MTQPGRWWRLITIALLGAGVFVWQRHHRVSAQPPPGDTPNQAGPARERPVPVSVTTVEPRDVPIYLEGLGTVNAYYTATVRPRVDGQLVSVLFREGQTVHQGDVLAQIDPRPFVAQLHQAQGALARDRAQLDTSRRTLERSRQLRDQNLIAQQDYDVQLGQTGQFEGAVSADRAQVENAQLQLQFTRVVAPIDGVAGVRQIDPGNLVHTTDTNGIVVITQIDPITVLFTLPQDDLPRVARQMAQSDLQVDVFSRDGSTRLGTGRLALVDNQINQATATIRLKAVFSNPDRQLWPQQFVKTRLLLDTRHSALVVPASAVQRGPQGTFVYVVGANLRANVRPVNVDQLAGDQALISTGLTAGEKVVTEGQNRLRPGASVELAPAAPSTQAPAAHRESEPQRPRGTTS